MTALMMLTTASSPGIEQHTSVLPRLLMRPRQTFTAWRMHIRVPPDRNRYV